MAESHFFHVEHKDDTGSWPVFVQARINGHKERFDSFVKNVIRWFRIVQSMKYDRVTIWTRWQIEIVSDGVK